nr:hypothetical protein [Tanacetum cinerariifolium]
MEALIEDEYAMDKGVVDTVQDHKRKHDGDDDDDDEDPLARPNQGKKTKRRRTMELESSKKLSSTKEIQKGKALTKGSKTGKSTPTKELAEEPIAEVIMDYASDGVVRDDDQPQDASIPKIAKTLNLEWFKQPPRPPTPDLKWNECRVILDQPEQPWFYLQRILSHTTTSWLLLLTSPSTCTSSIVLEYIFQECFNALTDRLDENNPERDRYPFALSKPLPLQGPPGHRTVVVDYFFNNDLEYLKTSDLKITYTASITKTKEACVKKLHGYGHLKDIVVKRSDQQFYKFKEGEFVDLRLNNIEDMLLLAVQHKLFHLDGSDIVDFIVALYKAALEVYDLQSALYQTMYKNKSFNRNPANHRLYHDLIEALIEDENAMDKGVTDTVQDHKRKHDGDDDDDNEGPSAGPNQGKMKKRRRTKES